MHISKTLKLIPPFPCSLFSQVLDVGCGVGGSSRYIARALGPSSEVTGITLSPNQVARATELANEQETPNAKFQVMNALEMEFPDNSFDIVWACESGEHMPDKKKYIDEMMRVLKVRLEEDRSDERRLERSDSKPSLPILT